MKRAGFNLGVICLIIGAFKLAVWFGFIFLGLLLMVMAVGSQIDVDRIIKENEIASEEARKAGVEIVEEL